ncbi:unnamed protein product [Spirodela intermedia]|uniref:Cupin type-1 domain-containing protein n=1 Tax=Spirodela intermedia TaxID=51605 RepID=A0A7I8JWC9_SPIIN|nr:unnamed protein product [Spirodela intermedia]
MTNSRSFAFLLLLSVSLAASATALSFEREDPELQVCRRQCRQQRQLSEREQRECERRCEDYAREKEERERGERGREREDLLGEERPEERLQQCQRRCEAEHGRDPGQRSRCQRRCQERYQEEQRERERGRETDDERREETRERLQVCRRKCEREAEGPREESECRRRCQERYQEEERREGREADPQREEEEEEEREGERHRGGRNPYFFDQESFQHRIRTQHGSVRVLERFTRRSDLLRGIEKYRLGFMEFNPNAFVLPHHLDADTIFYVVKGRGTLTIVREENNRETLGIRKGDILRIRAGSMVYLVNQDDNEKLFIAKILRTVATPGVLREYFAVGGENPESFLRSFSSEILEAAFKAPRESLEKMFRHQKGAIVQASKEQVRAMSRRSSEGGGHWPFGESSRTFNLLGKRPSISSRHGQLFEADAGDYRELEDLDIQVSFTNITGGSMAAPFYNTRSTKLSMVVNGEGYFEMACPHVSREGEERRERGEEEGERREGQGQQRQVHYQKMRSRLSCGTAFLVPAGHPVSIVASSNQNLQVICFEINARDNRRLFLAGKNSILKQLEREAKELSFNAPAKEVEEFLGRQEETAFVDGPERRSEQQREEKRLPLGSILDFAGF